MKRMKRHGVTTQSPVATRTFTVTSRDGCHLQTDQLMDETHGWTVTRKEYDAWYNQHPATSPVEQ